MHAERRKEMLKHSFPSIEQFAAYLDGNLSQSEMQQFSQQVGNNSVLHQLLDASDVVDDTIAGFTDADLQLPLEISGSDFEIPDFDNVPDNVDFLSLTGDSFSDNAHLYQQEGINAGENYQQESETLNNSAKMKSYRTYGESGENISDPIYVQQPDDHSCGLRSQQIVLRDFGIDIPFEDLERLALDAGVYSDDGTYTYDIGKVLEMAGVGMHQVRGGTIYDLTNELAQGHRVIVSVDAHELWYNDTVGGKVMNWLDDVFGSQGGNHALIVAGVEVNPANPKDAMVVLTDPGAGELRIEYPLNQFMDAWRDSNCFMVATNEAAPYQYDAATGMEVPSNFAVKHYYNQFVIDHSYQLNPDLINIPYDYHPAFTGHLPMIGDLTYDDYVIRHPFWVTETDGSVGETAGSVGETTGGVGESDASVGETTGGVGVDLLSPIGESDGGVGSGKLGRVGETAGGVGSESINHVGETTGSVGEGLLNPVGDNEGSKDAGLMEHVSETTGSIGVSSTSSVGETTGSVGSDLLSPIGETTGGVGSDQLESDEENPRGDDNCPLYNVEETTGGVGSNSISPIGETTGDFGPELLSDDGRYLVFDHDEFVDSSLDDDL